MTELINYKAKTNKELLVMSVMQGNDLTKQQEAIIHRLDELNGTVRSNYVWICALKWVVGFIAMVLIGIVTCKGIGVW